MKLVLAATGHRPPRLGLDYSSESNRFLTEFARKHLVFAAKKHEIVEVVTGGAQGWDSAVAHAALLLKIPYVVAIPFEGQESKWPAAAQARYHALLKHASLVHIVCHGGYSPDKFLERDCWMVDRAEDWILKADGNVGSMFALYDNKGKGGTAQTIKYAESLKVPVWNLWPTWLKGVSG